MEATHLDLMQDAIEADGQAQRALFAGDDTRAREAFARAEELYRRSWEAAPPGSYGRLVGMLKSAVLAGDAAGAARYVRQALPEPGDASPIAAYARAVAALIVGDDGRARSNADEMRGASEALTRAGAAIAALAAHDGAAYATALAAIVCDFELRSEHLTGVAIADTALMLERLAEPHACAAHPVSAVLP